MIEDALGGSNAVRDEDSSEITEGGNLDVFTLKVGDCFNDTSGTEITEVPVVPCSDPHDFEVFYEFDMPDGEFPGSEAIYAKGDEACMAPFEEFVGAAYETSVYDFSYLTPTEGGWDELDDRAVQCYLYEGEGKITGSAAGTAR